MKHSPQAFFVYPFSLKICSICFVLWGIKDLGKLYSCCFKISEIKCIFIQLGAKEALVKTIIHITLGNDIIQNACLKISLDLFKTVLNDLSFKGGHECILYKHFYLCCKEKSYIFVNKNDLTIGEMCAANYIKGYWKQVLDTVK